MQSDPAFEGILIVLKSIGLPFLLALMGCLWARRRRRERPQARLAAAFILLGMLAGYAAMVHEQWRFPPAQALDWLALVLPGSFLGLLALEVIPLGRRSWLGAQIVLIALGLWFAVPPAIAEAGAGQATLWFLALGAAWLALWRYLEALGMPQQPGIALTLSAGALGFVVSLGGSVIIGSVANSLMGALAGWLVASLAAGWLPLSRALLGSLVLAFGTLLLFAHFFAEISALLLGMILLGLLSVRLAGGGGPGRLRQALASGFATAPPLVLAVGFAVWSYLHQSPTY